MPTLSLGTAFIDGLVAPKAQFQRLPKANWKWPILLVLMLVAAAANYLLISGMSDQHLISQHLLQMQDLTSEEQAAATDVMSNMLPYMAIMTAASAAFTIKVKVALLSLYVWLVSKGAQIQSPWRYRDSFGFTVWTQLPMLVASIGLLLLVATASSSDLPLTIVNYASVNELALQLPFTHPKFQLASAISLFDVWCIALLAIGFKVSLNMPSARALLAALFPYAVVYGLWFLIA